MKKNYELVKINVISLDNEDVIATSYAKKGTTFFGGSFGGEDDTGLRTQDF